MDIHLHDIRDYTLDKHRHTDDYPFGGGVGMVMTPQPLFDCFVACLRDMGVNDVQTGEFGADMKVRLLNDGPVTILLDTDTWKRSGK